MRTPEPKPVFIALVALGTMIGIALAALFFSSTENNLADMAITIVLQGLGLGLAVASAIAVSERTRVRLLAALLFGFVGIQIASSIEWLVRGFSRAELSSSGVLYAMATWSLLVGSSTTFALTIAHDRFLKANKLNTSRLLGLVVFLLCGTASCVPRWMIPSPGTDMSEGSLGTFLQTLGEGALIGLSHFVAMLAALRIDRRFPRGSGTSAAC